MTLIGFDTSLPTTSVCVVRSDGASFFTPPPGPDSLLGPARHSLELLPELERRLSESATTWSDVDSIAVGVGPGTFTGLRIGVTTARALGQALGVQLRPVSSLEALATAIARDCELGDEDPVLALIDARRGQVFAALYAAPGIDHREKSLSRLWEPAVMNPETLFQRMSKLERAPVSAGDWAIRCRRELESVGAAVPPPDSGLHAVSALHVCRLSVHVTPVAPQDVYPVYLRLPDAEINKRLAEEQAG